MLIKAAVFLFIVFSIVGCKRQEAILTNIKEYDANEILVVLAEQNIKAHKKLEGNKKSSFYSVFVDVKDVNNSLKTLITNQLPRTPKMAIKDVFPPGSQGLIPSKSEENARLILAQQGEIETLLKALPEVMDAKVVLSLSEVNDYFAKAPHKKSASVVVISRNKEAIISEEEIKRLISGSSLDLLLENIFVMIKPYQTPNYINIASAVVVKKDDNKNNILFPFIISIFGVLISLYALFITNRRVSG